LVIEQVLIYGGVEGAVYALLAIGFSLVYGVGGILNLAHGAFYLIAAYLMLWFIPTLGIPGSVILSLLVTTLIGALTYLGAIKPLQKTIVGVVIITFAFGFFMEQFVTVVEIGRIGIATYATIPGLLKGGVTFLGVTFPAQFVLAFFGSLLVVFSVALFINKAKIGKSIRAVAEDREAAMLMGINADRILLITVALSAFLASVAAVLYAPADYLIPYMGWTYLLDAFSVVILGGLGSVPGSILAAFVIAYSKETASILINPALASVLVPLIVIIGVLIVRPQGLLGKKEVE
jgi:branched-chain amino acid transport system permease protein